MDELNDLNVAYRNDSKIKELVDMIKYCSVPVEVFKLIGDIYIGIKQTILIRTNINN